jgi:hypothetical protein
MSLLESPARVVTEMAFLGNGTWGRRVVGGVAVANPLWLAPLAEVSNFPVREMFRRLGAGLTHTEMISLSGLVHGNRTTVRMLPEGEKHRSCSSFLAAGPRTFVEEPPSLWPGVLCRRRCSSTWPVRCGKSFAGVRESAS